MNKKVVYYGKLKIAKYGAGKFIFSLPALTEFLRTQSFTEMHIQGKRYKGKAKKGSE